jgi:hypothetical protein
MKIAGEEQIMVICWEGGTGGEGGGVLSFRSQSYVHFILLCGCT